MNIYSLDQIVAMAKYTSPVYKDFYRHVEPGCPLTSLPVLSNEQLMEIVHDRKPDFVFAEGNTHGIIFESSASTGKPKVTLWGQGEWATSLTLLSTYHWKNGLLKNGDRVGNLCSTPYLSYRLVHSVVEYFPGSVSEVPIGCEMEFVELNGMLDKYDCNVFAAINSTVLGLAWDLLAAGKVNTTVERILAGGELLYGSQLELIRAAFPNAKMMSFLFGTTESGITAYSKLDDALDVFRPFPEASIVEILDKESGEPITTPGKIGKCVVTSLLRVAAPALRIDTGDYAHWIDEPTSEEPRFRVIGRRFPFQHQMGGVYFSETEAWDVIQELSKKVPLTKFQMLLYTDHVEVQISIFNGDSITAETCHGALLDAISNCIPELSSSRVEIRSTVVDFSKFLESTRRKGRLIVDCR